jgi:hypothetical protein
MHIVFLKTIVVSVVMVAANAADQSCKEKWQMIDQVLCISRRTSSLLAPVLSTRFVLSSNSCFA